MRPHTAVIQRNFRAQERARMFDDDRQIGKLFLKRSDAYCEFKVLLPTTTPSHHVLQSTSKYLLLVYMIRVDNKM
jgi:hypothetical protein